MRSNVPLHRRLAALLIALPVARFAQRLRLGHTIAAQSQHAPQGVSADALDAMRHAGITFDASGYSMNVKPMGHTYWQIVSLAGAQVVARALLAPSESDDPASPHHADGTRDFAARLRTLFPFSEETIARDPALSTQTLSTSSDGKAQ